MQIDAMRGGLTAMTQSNDADDGMASAIGALRHEILSAGRNLAWDEVRARMKALIRDGRPTSDQRIQLLELYDRAVTTVRRRHWGDPEAARRLDYQRANDTLLFLVAEFRDEGEAMGAIMARELAAGRLELGGYFSNVVSLIAEKFDGDPGGEDREPDGVAEDDAGPWLFPPPFSPPPASSPVRPWR
jgi:hypothetical protein